MRAAAVIALKDLRRALRDRSAIAVAVLAPLVLAFILSTVLGGNIDSLEIDLAFADADGGRFARTFRARVLNPVEKAGLVRVRDAALEDARRLIEEGEVAAALVVPEGFSGSVATGRDARIVVLASEESQIGVDLARALGQGFAARLNSARLAVATLAFATGDLPADAKAIARRVAGAAPAIRTVATTARSREFQGNTFFAAGMTVFFLFFTAQFGAVSLLRERREGTLARLLASPASRASIIAGKGLYTYALGAGSMMAMVVATALLMGARWGDPAGIALVIAAGVFAAMGIQSLVSTLARTDEQAAGYGSIVGVTLGLLGGTFFPLSQAPSVLTNLSAFTPHAVMMRAFAELSGGIAGAGDVAAEAGILVLTGVVFGAAALARAERLVAT